VNNVIEIGSSPVVVEIGRYGLADPRREVEDLPAPLGKPTYSYYPSIPNRLSLAFGSVHNYQLGQAESGLVLDESDFKRALALADHCRQYAVFDVEKEQFEKVGSLSTTTPGFAIRYEPVEGVNPSLTDEELLTVYRRCFTYLRKQRVKRHHIPKVSYPRQSNHGAPDWSSSDESLVWHVTLGKLARAAGLDHHAVVDLIADHIGIDRELQWSSTVFRRSGPTTKGARVHDPGTGKYLYTSYGEYARDRLVFGFPTVHNAMDREDSLITTGVIWANPRHFHRTPLGMAMELMGHEIVEIDISGFDASVHIRHQMIIGSLFVLPLAGKAAETRFRQVIRIPELGPPLGGIGFTKFMIKDKVLARVSPTRTGHLTPKVGTTPSGTVNTYRDGTLINFAMNVYCLAQMVGVGDTLGDRVDWVLYSLETGKFKGFFHGDDTILGFPKGFKLRDNFRERYAEHAAAFGFKIEIGRNPVFLMRAIDTRTGRDFGLVSRFVQNELFRERPRDDLAVNLLATGSRIAAIVNHPNGRRVLSEFQDWYLERYGVGWEVILRDFVTGHALVSASASNPLLTIEWLKSATKGQLDSLTAMEIARLLGLPSHAINTVEDLLDRFTLTDEDLRVGDYDSPVDFLRRHYYSRALARGYRDQIPVTKEMVEEEKERE
jgi:hypothetical protein